MICVHKIQTLAYAAVVARARRSRHPAHQGPLGESPSTLSFPRGKPVGDVSGVTPKDAASWCRTPWPTLLMSSEGLRPMVHPYFVALGQPCRLPRCQVPLRRGRTLQPASATTAACARVCILCAHTISISIIIIVISHTHKDNHYHYCYQ